MLEKGIFERFVSHQVVEERLRGTQLLECQLQFGHQFEHPTTINSILQLFHHNLYIVATELLLGRIVVCAADLTVLSAMYFAACYLIQMCPT